VTAMFTIHVVMVEGETGELFPVLGFMDPDRAFLVAGDEGGQVFELAVVGPAHSSTISRSSASAFSAAVGSV
jgi:hypothetical protein